MAREHEVPVEQIGDEYSGQIRDCVAGLIGQEREQGKVEPVGYERIYAPENHKAREAGFNAACDYCTHYGHAYFLALRSEIDGFLK
jgi:hypothetical protein